MGDQDYLRRFDLPFRINDIVSSLDQPREPKEVIVQLVHVHHPVEYRHFPYSLHSAQEEVQRCIALREFLFGHCVTILYRHEGLGRDGLFPTDLIISAVVDKIKNLSDEEQRKILEASFTALGLDSSAGTMERLERFVDRLNAPISTSKPLSMMDDPSVWDYCTEQRMSVEALIDPRTLSNDLLTLGNLCAIEFALWIGYQRSSIFGVLRGTTLVDSPCFERGKLLAERLSPDILVKLQPRSTEPRQDRRHEHHRKLKSSVQLTAIEVWREKGIFKPSEFYKSHVEGIIKKKGRKKWPVSKKQIVDEWLNKNELRTLAKSLGLSLPLPKEKPPKQTPVGH